MIINTLLELILDNVDIFNRSEAEFRNNKRNRHISIQPKYYNKLINYLSLAATPATGIPEGPLNFAGMVSKPKPWINEKEGGYYLRDYRNLVSNNILIHLNKRNPLDTIILEDQKKAYNYMNKQKFKINKNMLIFLLQNLKNDKDMIFWRV